MTTTEEKSPTQKDVVKWYGRARLPHGDGVERHDCEPCRSLESLRDAALLGVQVPGLRADNAALETALRSVLYVDICGPNSGPGPSAHRAAYAVLDTHARGQSLIVQHDREVSALQARVVELEVQVAERDEYLRVTRESLDGCTQRVLALKSERDALRAQVDKSERTTSTLQVERNRAFYYQKVLRQRFDTARNDALEEAAVRIDVEAQESHTREAAALLDDMASRVRSLKTAALSTPPAEVKKPEATACSECLMPVHEGKESQHPWCRK